MGLSLVCLLYTSFQFQPDRGFRQLDLSRGDHHADEHQLRPGTGLVADQFPVFLRRAILSGAPEVFREFFQFSPFVGGKVRFNGEQIPLRFPPDAGCLLYTSAADAARAVVLPSADSFEEVTLDEMPEGGVDIYEATNGTGYVVTAQSKGYGGMLKVMVGIDSNGVITGTEVLENNETQGLGSKVSEHAFMDQYLSLIHIWQSRQNWRCHADFLLN